MKLAKALKEKNRIVGQINKLKAIVQRENSREVKSSSKVDREKVYAELTKAIEELVTLKTAIFQANRGIYASIVAIGEMKAMIPWLQGLTTTTGVVETPQYGRNGEVYSREYTAFLTQEDIDAKVAEFEASIAKLQDEIDAYNATTEI